MKKIGSINEARMYKKEPKFYSLVSDDMFNRVVTSPEQLKENAKKGYADMGIKGGTKAAAKEAERRMKKRRKLEEDDLDNLPMNKTPEASKMTTNSPRRTTSASTQVYNSMTDAKDPNLQELTPAGKQAAKLRAREKRFDAAGKPFDAGRMRGRRQHNINVRQARPKTSPAGRVPDKSYREDPV
jgi:hypothetical protein